MLAGAVIANLGDVIGVEIDLAPIERGGEIALQAFVVMYLMSVKLWTLGGDRPPDGQRRHPGCGDVMIGVLLLFRWLGR